LTVRKLPLPLYVATGAASQGALYSTLALVAARRDRRRGWRDGRPGPLNRAGLGLSALGLGVLGWAAIGHHKGSPDNVSISVTSDYVTDQGAYGFTRNPLYLGGMTVWFGWALWRGSRRSALVGAAWLTGLAGFGVPFEERKLEAKFGASYRDYKQRVPRWF